jgi:hypothetical protein
MSATRATMAGRRAAERNMADTCTVTRVTGASTDLQTAAVTETTAAVYTGKCRVQQTRGISRPTTVAEAYVFQTRYELQLPVATSPGIQIGDVVTITAAALDADLVGRTYWVRELADKTHATARRIGIEEVSG